MINGILNIYKEKGYTSHDVVACLRRMTGQKKIGHTGTLDPDAEGVLPVCLGKATKVCDMLTERDKTYETVLLLGKVTDTQDITGTVLEECSPARLMETDPEQVTKCICGFEGIYDQIPPMYSALKINGKKLYELAREGKTVERKSRKVTIYAIQVTDINMPEIRIKVHCSKGTYIRTLCHDIGERLGVGGCMKELIRTKAGAFDIHDSFRLKEIEKMAEENRLQQIIIPVDAMFRDYRKVLVKGTDVSLAYNGNPLRKEQLKESGICEDGEKIRIYDEDGRFIGIYRYEAEQMIFRLEKMFLDRDE